jgi:glycosyltransferase involved in cell wall biosynthesis
MSTPLFTVFTPVYNRRNTLHRVWESLCEQICRDFEWIVVDDGSTDGVGELIKQYQSQATFPMTVIKQTNQGKHIAWNKAVTIAKGELFVPADSDDSFIPTALERFAVLWDSIPAMERVNYSGINCLCQDPDTADIIGNCFPQNLMVTNNLELFFRYKVTGEKWGCIRIDLLRKLPFPEIPGTNYPATYLWYSLARNYHVFCVNEVLRYYYQDQPNHISAGKAGGTGRPATIRRHFFCWHLNTNWDYIGLLPLGRIKALAGAARASMEMPGGVRQSLLELQGAFRRFLFLLMLPVAHLYWRR